MSRGRAALLLLLLAVVVNLPLAHSTWTQRQVERNGVVVTVTGADVRPTGDGERWVSFQLPEDIDPEQLTWKAQIDEATYDEVQRTGELDVQVLVDDPSAFVVEGAVDSNVALVATLVADVVLLLLFLLVWRKAGRRPLQVVALEGVQRCPPGVLMEQLNGDEYLIRGDVVERDRDRVVLDIGDRTVVVLLDGNANPVGYQQSAQVRARLI